MNNNNPDTTNNVSFYRINNKRDIYIPEVKNVYETSFPWHERRDFESVLHLLSNPLVHLIVATGNRGEFVGFAVGWTLEGWLFIEHLAVKKEYRGNGYGNAIITFLKKSTFPLILETEQPVTEEAIRRVHFYERQGLLQIPVVYMQPSYHKINTSYPMLLMSTRCYHHTDDYKTIIESIKKVVYEQP